MVAKASPNPSDGAFPWPRAERLPSPPSDKAPSTEVLQLSVKPNQTTKQIKTKDWIGYHSCAHTNVTTVQLQITPLQAEQK